MQKNSNQAADSIAVLQPFKWEVNKNTVMSMHDFDYQYAIATYEPKRGTPFLIEPGTDEALVKTFSDSYNSLSNEMKEIIRKSRINIFISHSQQCDGFCGFASAGAFSHIYNSKINGVIRSPFIFLNDRSNLTEDTFAHELGHLIDYSLIAMGRGKKENEFFEFSSKKEWKELFKKYKDVISEIDDGAKTNVKRNPTEMFAEVIRIERDHPGILEEIAPEVHAFASKSLNELLSYAGRDFNYSWREPARYSKEQTEVIDRKVKLKKAVEWMFIQGRGGKNLSEQSLKSLEKDILKNNLSINVVGSDLCDVAYIIDGLMFTEAFTPVSVGYWPVETMMADKAVKMSQTAEERIAQVKKDMLEIRYSTHDGIGSVFISPKLMERHLNKVLSEIPMTQTTANSEWNVSKEESEAIRTAIKFVDYVSGFCSRTGRGLTFEEQQESLKSLSKLFTKLYLCESITWASSEAIKNSIMSIQSFSSGNIELGNEYAEKAIFYARQLEYNHDYSADNRRMKSEVFNEDRKHFRQILMTETDRDKIVSAARQYVSDTMKNNNEQWLNLKYIKDAEIIIDGMMFTEDLRPIILNFNNGTKFCSLQEMQKYLPDIFDKKIMGPLEEKFGKESMLDFEHGFLISTGTALGLHINQTKYTGIVKLLTEAEDYVLDSLAKNLSFGNISESINDFAAARIIQSMCVKMAEKVDSDLWVDKRTANKANLIYDAIEAALSCPSNRTTMSGVNKFIETRILGLDPKTISLDKMIQSISEAVPITEDYLSRIQNITNRMKYAGIDVSKTENALQHIGEVYANSIFITDNTGVIVSDRYIESSFRQCVLERTEAEPNRQQYGDRGIGISTERENLEMEEMENERGY